MKTQKIHTTADYADAEVTISGWLQGKETYLRIGNFNGKRCLGTLSNQKLYRLAKAIVRQFEGAK